MADYSGTIKELLRGITQIVERKFAKTLRIYDGLVVGSNINNKWQVRFNGETHTIPHYGDFSVKVGKVVKVFVPENNMALAFFE